MSSTLGIIGWLETWVIIKSLKALLLTFVFVSFVEIEMRLVFIFKGIYLNK